MVSSVLFPEEEFDEESELVEGVFEYSFWLDGGSGEFDKGFE